MKLAEDNRLSLLISDLQGFDAITRDSIDALTQRISLPKNHILLSEGEVNNKIYFIEKGIVRSFRYEEDREVTSWIAAENSFVWQFTSYILNQPSKEIIQAIEDTTLFSISKEDIIKLKKINKNFSDIECNIMNIYLKFYERRISNILIPKAEKRLEYFIKENKYTRCAIGINRIRLCVSYCK